MLVSAEIRCVIIVVGAFCPALETLFVAMNSSCRASVISETSPSGATVRIGMNGEQRGASEPSKVGLRIRQRFPDFLQSVNIKHLKLGYHHAISQGVMLLMAPLLIVVFVELGRLSRDGKSMRQLWQQLEYNLVSVMLCSGSLIFAGTLYFASRPHKVYLVDFACYRPHQRYLVSHDRFIQCSEAAGTFTEESLQFQRRIVERSGLGPETYLPSAILSEPPNPCMIEARLEANEVMFNMLDELFQKTRVEPKDVGILVVNCSLFNPTPSLTSMIVNHYKLRGSIKTFNLGGMGCSAGLIAIDLVKDLLQVHSNSYAVVVSMENLSLAWYFGNDRSMLVSNCIFRMGGAAVLLSNVRCQKGRAKYELVHTVRTHKGADDTCYNCVYQREDIATEEHFPSDSAPPSSAQNGCPHHHRHPQRTRRDGKFALSGKKRQGVCLSRDLMSVAGDALKTNITTLGPLVLPLREQLLFFLSLFKRKLINPKAKPYIPNFKLAFEHFCIHAGGRAVLEEMEKNLSLSAWHMEPSRMTLHRFGNTSSSSLWYELSYTEEKGRMKRGHRVWQIAFGSGFKCNSAVWRALRTIEPHSGSSSPWSDSIHKYPVDLNCDQIVVAKNTART